MLWKVSFKSSSVDATQLGNFPSFFLLNSHGWSKRGGGWWWCWWKPPAPHIGGNCVVDNVTVLGAPSWWRNAKKEVSVTLVYPQDKTQRRRSNKENFELLEPSYTPKFYGLVTRDTWSDPYYVTLTDDCPLQSLSKSKGNCNCTELIN